MAIISQETWDNMPVEEKSKIIESYNSFSEASGGLNYWVKSELEVLFGKENLQPKPKIRTWEDVMKLNKIFNDTDIFFSHPNINWIWGKKVVDKCIATAKIAKLIELGYGGLVSEKKWRDTSISKWIVTPNWKDKGFHIEHVEALDSIHFIAFHFRNQAEEFMSYPENVELVKQYYMI